MARNKKARDGFVKTQADKKVKKQEEEIADRLAGQETRAGVQGAIKRAAKKAAQKTKKNATKTGEEFL